MSVKLNQHLVKKQGLTSADETRILKLHAEREFIEDELYKTPRGTTQLYKLLNDWTVNQFALQRAWKFPENADYHRWWWIKGCTCPKIDNDDNYPYGYYVRVQDCKYHGWDIDDIYNGD
jgi:hypothetical protein